MIPVTNLRDSPFNHDWGASIYAKVSATNIVGSSDESQVGNGALILTQPDAPINLSDDTDITDHTQIGLTW